MGKGMAKEVNICGHVVKLGDWLKVRYTTGTWSKNGTIKGEVVELWSPELNNHLQGRLACGWCFHDKDEIIEHKPKEEARHD